MIRLRRETKVGSMAGSVSSAYRIWHTQDTPFDISYSVFRLVSVAECSSHFSSYNSTHDEVRVDIGSCTEIDRRLDVSGAADPSSALFLSCRTDAYDLDIQANSRRG